MRELIEHREYNGGVITVVATPNGSDTSFHYGVSYCSPADQFKRKRGVMLARGRVDLFSRLTENDVTRHESMTRRAVAGAVKVSTDANKNDVMNTIYGAILTAEGRPLWM